MLAKFKSYLADVFKLKDLGPPKYYLGLKLARSAYGIVLNQRKYVLDLLTKFGYLECKPAMTSIWPLITNCKSPLLMISWLIVAYTGS